MVMALQSSVLEITICTRSAAGLNDTPVNNVFVAEDYPQMLSKHFFAVLFESIEHLASANQLISVSFQVVENFADLASFKRLSVSLSDPTAKRFLLEASGLPSREGRVKLQIHFLYE